MKRTSDVTILGTVVYGVSISTTTFTLRLRTSLGSTQMNNQSKASKSDRYWVMTSEKRSPTYVVYHFDTQRLSSTRVCKKYLPVYLYFRFWTVLTECRALILCGDNSDMHLINDMCDILFAHTSVVVLQLFWFYLFTDYKHCKSASLTILRVPFHDTFLVIIGGAYIRRGATNRNNTVVT